MDNDVIKRIRKLNQQHSYTSIQMHEAIARKLCISVNDHKYLGFLMRANDRGRAGKFNGVNDGGR